jgi:hypothetical protein
MSGGQDDCAAVDAAFGLLHDRENTRNPGNTDVSHETWVINAPTVVSEIIDGELVVINLEKGSYYCSLGIGAYLWQCLQQRASVPAIETALVDGYGIAPEQARADLQSFLAALKRENLVRAAGPDEAVASPAPAAPGDAYAAPDLKIYSDMQDLLLLDPIHDVTDEGWPTRPVESGA